MSPHLSAIRNVHVKFLAGFGLALAMAVLFSASPASAQIMSNTPINIGQKPQLFFDNHMVEMVHYLTRRVHRPEKHPRNPLIVKDKPWEDDIYIRTGTFCVAWDPLEELFKCWYCDKGWDYDAFMGRDQDLSGLVPKGWWETQDWHWLYAESEDGLKWRKPPLDYRVFEGQKTNICLGRPDYGQVMVGSFFLDDLEKDPEKRFKSMHWRQRGNSSDIRIAHSADGRSWVTNDDPVIVGGNHERRLGDEMMILPDTVTGQYILNVRENYMEERLDYTTVPVKVEKNWDFPYYPDAPLLMNKRRVFVTNSNSLNNWPTLREVMVPDDRLDNIDEAHYSMPILRIGDVFVAFLNCYYEVDNTMDVRMLFSRDAYNWTPVDRGCPYLVRGSEEEGAWDRYMVEIGNSVILREDKIYIFYGGGAAHHDWWEYGEKEGLDMPDEPGVSKFFLGLATLRPEGFVSLDSTVRPGLLLTRPFISDGSQLQMNAVCGKTGYVDVELTDAEDNVIAGYERSACDRFDGDAARHVVTWNGKSQLPSEVLAQGAKLRFFTQHAALYSFRIIE